MLLYVLYIIMYFGKERSKILFKVITINPMELSHKDTFTATGEFSDRAWS